MAVELKDLIDINLLAYYDERLKKYISDNYGSLVYKPTKNDFPASGDKNVIYLAQDTKILYYWDGTSYQEIISQGEEIDFKTATIEFDNVNDTFNLPIENKVINVYVDGMYLTEDEDYTIDRTASPNKITFFETWEDSDICTITWIEGTYFSSEGGSGSGEDINISLATRQDILGLFA